MKRNIAASMPNFSTSPRTAVLVAKTKCNHSEPSIGKPSTSYMLVEITTENGSTVRRIVESTVVLNLASLKGFLVRNGHRLDLDAAQWRQIKEDLSSDSKNELKLVESLGFHGMSYLSSRGTIYGKVDPYLFLNPDTAIQLPEESTSGSFKQWKKKVAVLAPHSSRMMLALASSFAGLSIHFSKVDIGGFHFHGKSSDGKTTCLLFAASVCGNEGYYILWNATETAIEETARGYNDSPLIFDELKLLDGDSVVAANKASKIVYMLAEGCGKKRSVTYQTKTKSFRTWILSAGEQSMHEHATGGGLVRMEGEKVRLIDVPSDAGKGMGIFDSLPDDCDGPNELANRIRDLSARYHGTAKPKFIERLTRRELTENGFVRDSIERNSKEFLQRSKVDLLDASALRFANKFAFSYAIGCIAIELKILPFKTRTMGRAILKCYRDAVSVKPKSIKEKRDQALNLLKEKFTEDALIDIRQDRLRVKESEISKAKGFLMSIKGQQVRAIKNVAFSELIPEFDVRDAVLSYLKNDFILLEKGGGITRSINISKAKKRVRCLCILEEVFGR